MHLALVVAFAWYREDSLDKSAVDRLFEGREPEEGANGRQAQVSRPDADASIRLEICEERADERRIEIVKGQGRRKLAEPRLCKREQQPERVPVGCDRVGADVALTHEPLGEVTLDQRGDVVAGLHGLVSHRRSSRRAASCISSGQAERYQYVSRTQAWPR